MPEEPPQPIIPFPPDKILLIRRRSVPFTGYWALPGGRVAPGEAVEKAVIRWVKEETGLNVTIVKKISEHHERDVQNSIEYDSIQLAF